MADTLRRKDYAWWANMLNVFSEYFRYDIDKFWDYITPEPLVPNQSYIDSLSTETPVLQLINRDTIPIDYVLIPFLYEDALCRGQWPLTPTVV